MLRNMPTIDGVADRNGASVLSIYGYYKAEMTLTGGTDVKYGDIITKEHIAEHLEKAADALTPADITAFMLSNAIMKTGVPEGADDATRREYVAHYRVPQEQVGTPSVSDGLQTAQFVSNTTFPASDSMVNALFTTFAGTENERLAYQNWSIMEEQITDSTIELYWTQDAVEISDIGHAVPAYHCVCDVEGTEILSLTYGKITITQKDNTNVFPRRASLSDGDYYALGSYSSEGQCYYENPKVNLGDAWAFYLYDADTNYNYADSAETVFTDWVNETDGTKDESICRLTWAEFTVAAQNAVTWPCETNERTVNEISEYGFSVFNCAQLTEAASKNYTYRPDQQYTFPSLEKVGAPSAYGSGSSGFTHWGDWPRRLESSMQLVYLEKYTNLDDSSISCGMYGAQLSDDGSVTPVTTLANPLQQSGADYSLRIDSPTITETSCALISAASSLADSSVTVGGAAVQCGWFYDGVQLASPEQEGGVAKTVAIDGVNYYIYKSFASPETNKSLYKVSPTVSGAGTMGTKTQSFRFSVNPDFACAVSIVKDSGVPAALGQGDEIFQIRTAEQLMNLNKDDPATAASDTYASTATPYGFRISYNIALGASATAVESLAHTIDGRAYHDVIYTGGVTNPLTSANGTDIRFRITGAEGLNAPLFGELTAGGTLKNISLLGTEASPNITGDACATVCGINGGKIENVVSSLGMTASPAPGGAVGGIAAVNNGTIKASTYSGTISVSGAVPESAIGGIAGRSGTGGTIESSVFSGSVSIGTDTVPVSLSGALMLGGIVGENNGSVTASESDPVISASKNINAYLEAQSGCTGVSVGGIAGKTTAAMDSADGSIVYTGESTIVFSGDAPLYVGGIAGETTASLKKCRAVGGLDVTVSGGSLQVMVGGLSGRVGAAISVTDCSALGDVSLTTESGFTGTANAGGLFGSQTDGSAITFAGECRTDAPGKLTVNAGGGAVYAGGAMGGAAADIAGGSVSEGVYTHNVISNMPITANEAGGALYVGGFAGKADVGVSISFCRTNSNISLTGVVNNHLFIPGWTDDWTIHSDGDNTHTDAGKTNCANGVVS